MSDAAALTLQDLLDGIKRDALELGETIDRLAAENTKLWELIHILCYCMHDEEWAAWCVACVWLAQRWR